MLTLPHLLTTARRFVDGVCKVPGQLDLILEAVENYDPQGWRAHSNSNAEECLSLRAKLRDAIELRRSSERNALDAEQQLSAEREAHAETAGNLGDEARTAMRLAKENRDLLEQLSAARADLEVLTRWRLQSEEPCPVPTFVEVSINSPRLGICLDRCGKLEALDSWRFTPESLAAWKAKGGEDGK